MLGAAAHELGHAAALDSADDGNPDLTYESGHVPPTSKTIDAQRLFGPSNSLWPGSMVLHDHVTFGQLYWMNFSGQSFLAQIRAGAAGASPNVECPVQCAGYWLDFQGPDPRLGLAAVAKAKVVGQGRNAAVAAGVCGAERNEACPESVFSQLRDTVNRLEGEVEGCGRAERSGSGV